MKKKIIELSSKTIKTLAKIYPQLRIVGKTIEKISPHIHHVSGILPTKKKKTRKKKEQKQKLISQKTNIISKTKINKKMKKRLRRLRTYRHKFKMESPKILKEVMAGVGTTSVAKGLLGSSLLSSLVGIGGGYLIGKWNGVIGSVIGLILPSGEQEGGIFSVPRLYEMKPHTPYEGRKKYYSKVTGKIINF